MKFENSSLTKTRHVLYVNTYVHFFIISGSIHFEREMFVTKFVETIKTKILFSIMFLVTRAVLRASLEE